MQVILLQDVAKIGQRYDLKKVADGFGRNYLIARKLAIIANPDNLKKLEQWKQARQAENQLQQQLLEKTIAQLAESSLRLKVKASPEGHLFAGVHQEDIAKALKRDRGLDLPPEAILLEQAIKSVGEHTIKVKTGQVSGQFTLVLEPKA